MTEKSDGLAVPLRAILADALRGTWAKVPKINADYPEPNREWAIGIRDAWIRSLRASFSEQYQDKSFAVFGGKPAAEDKRRPDVPSGIPGWGWEFLYDITVVELGHSPAAFANTNVAFVKRAVWQVESEVAGNGTEIAKDLSKLRVGAADHKLLVARPATNKPQRWLDFIGRISRGMNGKFFLGLMPSYASTRAKEAQPWRDCRVTITLYRCPSDGSAPRLISEI